VRQVQHHAGTRRTLYLTPEGASFRARHRIGVPLGRCQAGGQRPRPPAPVACLDATPAGCGPWPTGGRRLTAGTPPTDPRRRGTAGGWPSRWRSSPAARLRHQRRWRSFCASATSGRSQGVGGRVPGFVASAEPPRTSERAALDQRPVSGAATSARQPFCQRAVSAARPARPGSQRDGSRAGPARSPFARPGQPWQVRAT
jgi:hypothetical protein